MDAEPLRLLSKYDQRSDTFALYPDRLDLSWRHGVNAGRIVIPLSSLSPTLAFASGRSPQALRRLRQGLVVITLAAVIFWSVIQEAVPLLAPILAMIGFSLVVTHIKYLQARRWTTICYRNGKSFAYFRHDGCDEAERKRFEEAYAEAFKTVSAGSHG